MIKIAHTADVHFGVENYGKIDSNSGLHSRLLDFVACFNFCVDTAIKENVDLFILAGDAYKTANPSPTHQKFLFRALLKLQQANIPVVIVVGNHDNPVSFGKAHALDVYSDLPLAGFHVFSKPAAIKIQTKSGPVQIVGIPWPSRQQLICKKDLFVEDSFHLTDQISSSCKDIIKKLAESLDPSIPAILTGHLTVANGVFSGSEKRAVFGNDPLFFPSDLDIEPFNYVALGHLHRNQSLNKCGTTPIIYSGSIERVDFGEVRDSKGFIIAEINTEKKTASTFVRTANTQFIETPARKMLEINVQLLADSEAQTKQILDHLKTVSLKNAIVKLFYHLPPGSPDTVDLSLVGKKLSESWHLTGIIPVHKQIARMSRASLSFGVNYCNSKEILSPLELFNIFLQKKGLPLSFEKKILEQAKKIISEHEEKEFGEINKN